MQKFYSNGKLLISGEYLILDGAMGLALPTLQGQDLFVEKVGQDHVLSWKSLNEDNSVWFEASFNLPKLEIIKSKGEEKVATTLVKILRKAKASNPDFLGQAHGIKVTTKLHFPRNWGLGSSSTLINNIAQWAEVDAFKLLFESFGGSGYDIACAQNNQSILYQLKQGIPFIEKVVFDPPFKNHLYFVHLNKKQVSSESIKSYKTRHLDLNTVQRISKLTQRILLAHTLTDFNHAVKEHEDLISTVLNQMTIQEKYFSDYKGQTKSLGAWGGDFILAAGDESSMEYFKKKGFGTVLPYASMIKEHE
ncbi:GYDIA family GHMP kinase [Lutimonas sp.]|uniref:GYDIA family GHMP kinase n=1 Tax=Lutimonas sp. TaxID=1872403 RepID=UPI003D9B2D5F